MSFSLHVGMYFSFRISTFGLAITVREAYKSPGNGRRDDSLLRTLEAGLEMHVQRAREMS